MRRVLGRLLLATAVATAIVWGLDRAFPPDLSRYRERSFEVLDRDGRLLRLFPTGDGKVRLATTPDLVDQRYLDLLLPTEDRRFWQHPGVDSLALARAAWQLASTGHIVSGGSTLTMQVARLLAPHPHDVAGKLFDIARALQLERRYSKRDILAMYLTLAPMGGNLEGVRAAARVYFGHEPATLRPEEAALLVAIPQSPTRLRPDRHADAARVAMTKILTRASPDVAAELGDDAPLGLAREPLPMHALHLADRLHARGETGTVRTTIDAALQIAIENLAAREASWSGDHANIAALVVANRDRSVLAYLGGSDYFGPNGMVDMVTAPRSPGSTLKPFIYGRAIDESLIAPDTIIDDAPVQRGAYAPQNFDRIFHGAVTARVALQQSYNLPAVRVLDLLGPARFAADLRAAGAHLAFPHHAWSPGLPLALGGVGISLGDLAMLYAGLADGGCALPLRLEAARPLQGAAPLLSATAAAQVEEMLLGVPPPDAIAGSAGRAIAYKTGTSYGFRDALAIGSSGDYTVAVWVGRTEGTPRPDAYGRGTAAPILFQIFDLLPPDWTPAQLAIARPDRARRAVALRHLSATPGWQSIGGESATALQIVYPPAGAVIDLARAGDAVGPMTFEAVGGVPPYRWMVNGQIVPPPPTGASATWHPDGPGFATVSVTDARQHTAMADFRIE